MKHNMSRHYYDIAMLIQKGVSITALENQALHLEVIKNSLLNSTSSSDSKENADLYKLQNTSNLIPIDDDISILKEDYDNMKNSGMFFDDPISFDNIISSLRELEKTLNRYLRLFK